MWFPFYLPIDRHKYVLIIDSIEIQANIANKNYLTSKGLLSNSFLRQGTTCHLMNYTVP